MPDIDDLLEKFHEVPSSRTVAWIFTGVFILFLVVACFFSARPDYSTSYCLHVVRPKLCQVFTARGEFDDTTSCQHELSVYGFCEHVTTVPTLTMKACAAKAPKSKYLPEECLQLAGPM